MKTASLAKYDEAVANSDTFLSWWLRGRTRRRDCRGATVGPLLRAPQSTYRRSSACRATPRASPSAGISTTGLSSMTLDGCVSVTRPVTCLASWEPRPDVAARTTRQRTASRDDGSRFALLVAVATLTGVGVVLGVRLAADDRGPSDPNDAYGVTHVHGLGINPADDSLIVATHNGSFRIPADRDDAQRIGDSLQDTMGFTVVGPDHFLGSGHPDLAGRRAGQPAQLGLIESTDAGATWTDITLSGQADFHALAYVDDQIYGWDAGTGTLMVSTNRTDWETRSTLDLYGFAVDPDNPDHLVAATADGLVDSTDGGRSWVPSQGPRVVALSWEQTAGLWAVDAGGAVYRHGPSGWTPTGALPGEPQALLATPDTLYAATHDAAGLTGIYRSTDDGATWELRYQDQAP